MRGLQTMSREQRMLANYY